MGSVPALGGCRSPGDACAGPDRVEAGGFNAKSIGARKISGGDSYTTCMR